MLVPAFMTWIEASSHFRAVITTAAVPFATAVFTAAFTETYIENIEIYLNSY